MYMYLLQRNIHLSTAQGYVCIYYTILCMYILFIDVHVSNSCIEIDVSIIQGYACVYICIYYTTMNMYPLFKDEHYLLWKDIFTSC